MLSQPSHRPPLVAVKNLELTYPGSAGPALSIGDLTIAEGQCVVLCGPSGSGKSSFLKLLNGLVPDLYPARLTGELGLYPGSSRERLDAGGPASPFSRFSSYTQLGEVSVEELAYRVSSVFQNPSTQFFHSHVLQELVFPCENQGLSRQEIAERLDWVNKLFHLQPLYHREIASLSGGQRQRLAIAVASMQDTDIMVLDEPTANLDASGVAMVQEALQLLKKQGKTLIIAEHRLSYLNQLADRYLYFQAGHLSLDMDRNSFLAQSEQERQERGLRCLNPVSFAGKIAERYRQVQSESADLVVKDLSIGQGQAELVHIEQLELEAGKIVGLVGPNGSGKTSLARYLVGLSEQKTATIRWKGKLLSARERLEKISLVMQDVRLQLFAETAQRELILGRKSPVLDQALLGRFDLLDLLDRHPVSLSGGEQQRLILVASLLADKDIFIFDEPTSGLDWYQMQQVAQALARLKEENKLVLLISHDEELLELVCDKILDMKDFRGPAYRTFEEG